MGEEELGMDLFNLDELSELGSVIEPVVDTGEEGVNPSDDASSDENKDDDDNEKNINEEELGEGEENPDTVAKKTEDEDDPSKDGDEAASPDLYKSFATVLQEKGVFTSVEPSKLDEIKDVEGLVSLVKEEISRHELEGLTDLQKQAIEAYREGVPVKMFDEQVKVENQLDSISEERIEEEEDLRRTLIFQEYKSKGYSEQKAEKLTNRSFDLNEDLEDAKSALDSLKASAKAEFEVEKQKIADLQAAESAKATKEQEDLKNKIFNTNEVIKGYDISEIAKKKIYDDMMTPVSVNPENNKQENSLMKYQRENPQDFSHKLYYLFSVTNGFSDFSYFANKERSSSVNKLESAIRNSTHVKGGGDPSFLDDVNSSFLDIGDELVID